MTWIDFEKLEQSLDFRGANERLQLADQRLDALLAPVGHK